MSSIFDLIEGFESVDPADFAEYERAMREEVVPEIVRVVEQRERDAQESRRRILRTCPWELPTQAELPMPAELPTQAELPMPAELPTEAASEGYRKCGCSNFEGARCLN
jgi:hypothetical protein